MNDYITVQSAHCFFGNISNILNYHNICITEAELVLISNVLNGEYQNHSTIPFLGFQNIKCEIGLDKLNWKLRRIDEETEFFSMLEQGNPILLELNAQELDYSYVYNNIPIRKHYIVAIQCDAEGILISDSYIQTIPLSIYQGKINKKIVCEQFKNNQASGVVLTPLVTNELDGWKLRCNPKKQLDEYVLVNINGSDDSFYKKMHKYCVQISQNIADIVFTGSIDEIIYQMKFSGIIARWEYLIELFCNYYQINETMLEELNILKDKWNIVINKLRKCSITQKVDYCCKIFKSDIPNLLEKELNLYKKIAVLRGLENDRNNQ